MDPDPPISVIFIFALSLYTAMTVAEAVLLLQGRNQLQSQADGIEEARKSRGSGQPGEWADFLFTAGMARNLSAILVIGSILFMLPSERTLFALLGVVIALWLLLEMVQVAIKAYLWTRADSAVFKLSGLLWLLTKLFKPFFALLALVGKQIAGPRFDLLSVSYLLTRNGLRSLLDGEEEETNIPESEKRMITSILDLDELVVREIMSPRIDMVALDVETDLKAALEVIITAGHSRIPVFEGSADRIIGILYAKDLLTCFRDERMDVDIRNLLRPAHFVPVSKKVNSLFAEMQKQRVHIAIVVDEYGGTAGLVTIEDLLEEIVGDIQDEYDVNEDVLAEPIGFQAFLLNSRLDIGALAELLEIQIEDDNVDTVGGLIYALAGRVPAQGETVDYCGWRFTVLSIDGHRIEQIRAEKLIGESVDSFLLPQPADEQAAHESRQSAFSFLTSK